MNFQKEFEALKKKLDEAIKENIRDISESQQELDIIADVISKYPEKFAEKGGLDLIVQDAIDNAKAVAANGESLIKAYHILNKR